MAMLKAFRQPAWPRWAAAALAVVALGAALASGLARAPCHQRKVGGNGSAIYRPKGRIGNAGQLRTMVEYCNTDLGLSLFPDEVNAIAAVLNRDHYRF